MNSPATHAPQLIQGALLLLTVMALSSCASTGDQPTTSKETADGRVSTIPWNKPQTWESGGQLGSMMGH